MIRRPPRSTLFLHDALPICCHTIRQIPEMKQETAKQKGSTEKGILLDPERKSPRAAEFENKLGGTRRSEEHTSELQSHSDLVCRLLLEKKKNNKEKRHRDYK